MRKKFKTQTKEGEKMKKEDKIYRAIGQAVVSIGFIAIMELPFFIWLLR